MGDKGAEVVDEPYMFNFKTLLFQWAELAVAKSRFRLWVFTLLFYFTFRNVEQCEASRALL